MNRVKRILLTAVLFFCLNTASSQIQSGCYIESKETVYPDKVNPGLLNLLIELLFGTTNLYYNTSPKFSACGWGPKTGTACGVCDGTYTSLLGLLSGCNGVVLKGVSGTFSVIECDLDDYLWIPGLAAGLFGFFMIRKKSLL